MAVMNSWRFSRLLGAGVLLGACAAYAAEPEEPPSTEPAPLSVYPVDVRQALAVDAAAKAERNELTPTMVLAQYVRQTLIHNPQVFQSEAESRASESRIWEAREGFKPRLILSTSLGRERQAIDSLSSDNQFKQAWGQVRVTMPLYDKTLTSQLDQRRASSVGADWRLTDIREQMMLRTIETYIELVRNTNLVKLAQENLKAHRQYVAQIKEIAQSDLGRASDLPAAVGRVALAESVLTSRLGKLEGVRVSWRQLTGVAPDWELVTPPQVNLPGTVDAMVEQALEFNPVLQLAQSELQLARRGIDVAKAAYAPRVNVEVSSKSGTDWGGVLGNQTNSYAGVTLEWTALSGYSEHYSNRAAEEGVVAAQSALDRVRDELRARVEQTWFELQASDASLRSFEDYARNAELMVEASKNQFKIGRRSLLEVLNAESELFTARSNIESTLQDLKIAAWRLHSLQGRVQAELGI